MGLSSYSRLTLLCVFALAVVGCKPQSKPAFEPYARIEGGGVDATRPNCSARYRAFLDYAKAGSDIGHEVLQPADLGAGSGKTTWAKVAVYRGEGEDRIYVFTLPGHPAHPAVLIKSTFVTSEGMHQQVNGCAWGDRAAYKRFETAAQVAAAWFLQETRNVPSFDAEVPRRSQEPGEIRAKDAASLVGAVADRALLMAKAGHPPTSIYAFAPDDQNLAATHFTWLDMPSPSADRTALMDSAYVSVHTDAGAGSLDAWCRTVEAARTPRFCARAKKEVAEWALYRSM